MVGKQKKLSGFAEELKKLCKKHSVGAFIAGVCKQEDKEHGVHRMVFYGKKQHCLEIAEDMVDMFTEIGIGQHKEEDGSMESHTIMYR